MGTKVTIDKKNKTLTVVMDLIDPPRPSKSGTTLLVATTNGNVATDVEVNGKNVTVGLNAWIKP